MPRPVLTNALYISLYLPHKCTHFICIGISLSHMLTISLRVSGCLTHMLSLFLSLSDYYVPLFSLISVGKHYFSHMHIYTHTISTSPLYAHICAYVSPARTLSLGLSRTHCPPRHTSLLVVGRYDFIVSFGRIPLAVRLDGNTRQSFILVRIGPL